MTEGVAGAGKWAVATNWLLKMRSTADCLSYHVVSWSSSSCVSARMLESTRRSGGGGDLLMSLSCTLRVRIAKPASVTCSTGYFCVDSCPESDTERHQ